MSTDETPAGAAGGDSGNDAVGAAGGNGAAGGDSGNGAAGAAGGTDAGAPVRVTVPVGNAGDTGDTGDTAPGTTVVFEDPWRTATADTAGPDEAPAAPPSVTLAPGTAATYSLLVDGTRTADPANPDAAGPTASLVHHPSVDRSLWPARPADAVADMPGSRLRLDRAVLGRRATLRLDVPDTTDADTADTTAADTATAARPLPVVVVLDGDDWIHLHDLTTALDTAVTRGLLPPHVRVFVPAAPDRAEFADPTAAEGLVGPLLDTVTGAVTAAGARPGPVVLVGQSLGGLGAVLGALADRGRGRVAGVLAQSPSLWWPGAEEGDDAPLSGPAGGDLVQRAAGMDGADAGATAGAGAGADAGAAGAGMARLLLTVGEDEPEMHRHVDAGAEALRRLGADVTVRRVPGGHDRAMWRLGIVPGLAELLA
ncbi:alpha/beta hydrolase-fold protein [Corynebacterium bovis]|uniref:alpha/beta hydrolase-fold protein n=1 Tax=Corynebacterium bovis TaxID=36808 RepID=UPI0024498169|nr:alpha/beta hydrolase-fold protein [Corynebacterium bovis]MDH2456846.1 alpha/beta hydrolase-fold protein [Corynebacterium bovis]